MRLADKGTIITGAGGGMGRKAATMFAAEGAKVVCVDVTEEMAESAAAEVTAAGGQATAIAADVSPRSRSTSQPTIRAIITSTPIWSVMFS